MDVYGLRPVNKTAGIVTSQGGVTTDFLLADKETLKVLGERKRYLADAVKSMKEELGIDAREGRGSRTKYPPKILRHPKFKQFKKLKESLTSLDKEINLVHQRIKSAGPRKTLLEFLEDTMREKYPVLYQEIRDQYFAQLT